MTQIEDEIVLDLDEMIEKLTSVKNHAPGKLVTFDEKQIEMLILKAKEVFMEQPVFLELEAPIKICGDIHGQYYDLLRIFEFGGYPPQSNYLFLGDYVDRGKQNLETICLLMLYKIKYPFNFFLLRGNHESDNINRIYGFYEECKRRYSVKLWKQFTDCFNVLPVAALVEDRILCMHGGLSPELTHLDQIRNIKRPIAVPDKGVLCDLLWSDPDPRVLDWGENERGVSFTFGVQTVNSFLDAQDLDLIARAHQVVEDGYEFFANRKVVTIFSAPNYCGEFDNSAGIMIVGENLECSFKILQPAEKKAKEFIHRKKVQNEILEQFVIKDKDKKSDYEIELEWCISQIKIGLLSNEVTQEQLDEAYKTIKVLESSKTPKVKKRFYMKQKFGDYRKLMKEYPL